MEEKFYEILIDYGHLSGVITIYAWSETEAINKVNNMIKDVLVNQCGMIVDFISPIKFRVTELE